MRRAPTIVQFQVDAGMIYVLTTDGQLFYRHIAQEIEVGWDDEWHELQALPSPDKEPA